MDLSEGTARTSDSPFHGQIYLNGTGPGARHRSHCRNSSAFPSFTLGLKATARKATLAHAFRPQLGSTLGHDSFEH
eukprot:13720299-Alexandrium_andersonii.AAC.1